MYGERPFAGENIAGVVLAIAAGEIRAPPRGARVPVWLRRALLRGLAADPAKRWPSMDPLLDELSRGPGRVRRRVVALAGATLLAGAAAWVARGDPGPAPVCVDLAANLARVWDAERSAEVERAMLATGLPYAAGTWERAQRGLDSHAEAWLAARTESCLSFHRGELSAALYDRQTACLEEELREIAAAVEILAHTDAQAIERALQLVHGLGDLTRCREHDVLLAEVEPPEGVALAAAVAEQRDALVRAQAHERAGQYAVGLALADRAVHAAEALHYLPLTAEARLTRAILLERTGKYGESGSEFDEAFWAALAAGHDRIAVEVALDQQQFVGDKLRDFPAAERWARTAESLIARVGDRGVLRARVWYNRAIADRWQGKHEVALAGLLRAAEAFEARLGEGDDQVPLVLMGIGTELQHLKRFDEARAYLGRALALRERYLGERHPHVATTALNLGNLYGRQNRRAEARSYFERAIAIYVDNLGGEHPLTQKARLNLAFIDAADGRTADALRTFEEAQSILERVLQPGHPDLIHGPKFLAETFAKQKEDALALGLYERALALADAAPELAGSAAQLRLAMATLVWPRDHERARALALAAASAAEQIPSAAGAAAAAKTWLEGHPPP